MVRTPHPAEPVETASGTGQSPPPVDSHFGVESPGDDTGPVPPPYRPGAPPPPVSAGGTADTLATDPLFLDAEAASTTSGTVAGDPSSGLGDEPVQGVEGDEETEIGLDQSELDEQEHHPLERDVADREDWVAAEDQLNDRGRDHQERKEEPDAR
jgi:hypothetical protein